MILLESALPLLAGASHTKSYMITNYVLPHYEHLIAQLYSDMHGVVLFDRMQSAVAVEVTQQGP